MSRVVLHKSATTQDARGRLNPTEFHRDVVFETFAPEESLAPFIEHFWVIHSRSNRFVRSEQLMHRPYVDIFVSPDTAGVQGTFCEKRVYELAPRQRVIGARFLPGAFHLFYPGSMSELRGQVLPLGVALPHFKMTSAESMCGLTDQAVFKVLRDTLHAMLPKQDPRLVQVAALISLVEQFDHPLTVAELAKHFSKSERWVQQMFRTYIGLGLKQFLQIRRLLAAAAAIRNGRCDWAALAYDAGYSSQQHFIADFKRTTGRTPRQYHASVTHPNAT